VTGFGPATGKVFVAKGWNVVATMRDVSVANDLAERENVLVSRLDVTDPVSIGHAIEASIKLSASSTRLSIAGYGQYGVFDSDSPTEHSELL